MDKSSKSPPGEWYGDELRHGDVVLGTIADMRRGWVWSAGARTGTARSRYAAQRAVRRALRGAEAQRRAADKTARAARRDAMLAADGRDHSARAVMARMPVFHDPVISAAVASLEDDEDAPADA